MIVAPDRDTSGHDWLLVFTQNDHAHFACELLSLWQGNGLPDHPRRRELLFAAREHDNGWREKDAAPALNPETQSPHTFMTIPDATRREIWTLGTTRYLDREPFAALLIVEHAIHLHHSKVELPDWQTLFAHWHELRDDLMKTTETDEATLAADSRWIDLSDVLSLAALDRWSESFERGGFRIACSEDRLALDPFPFAGTTTFQVPCRKIPRRAYRSDSDLAMEIVSASWFQHSVKVAPLKT